MNRYDLWRFFGFLPEAPEEAYTGDPDQAFSALKSESVSIASLCSIAFRFSRLDHLKDILTAEDWDVSADGLLYRARLRFFRALAENPESPEIGLLDEAAADFRRAADHLSTSREALAGLVRIHALVDGTGAALKALRRLEHSGGRLVRPAAAGAYLFLAELPGTEASVHRKYLRRACRHLQRSERSNEIRLIQLIIHSQLGNADKARRGWADMAQKGSPEAQIHLIRDDINRWIQNRHNESRDRLLGELSDYRRVRPSDPRAFMSEGDLLLAEDSESARMAWRSALVLDDRYAEAWQRLGDLYKDAWDRGDDNFRTTWLDAASDAYIKAVTLEPLNPLYRLALGIVEREAGRPARAIGTLLGGLALVTDDPTFRRWLAMSWTDLAYSTELSPSARSAAAGRARNEWGRLLTKGYRHPYDLMGLLRSLALEAAGEPEKMSELEPQLSSLTAELLQVYPRDDSADLIGLAEDLIRANLPDNARILLDRASEYHPGHPGLLAARGALKGGTDPAESMKLYLDAAAAVDSGSPEHIDWILSASDMAVAADRSDEAESIIHSGLVDHPGNPALVKRLAEKLVFEDRISEVSDLYRNALSRSPDDQNLLEDAVWFTRSIGMQDLAESMLRNAVERNSEDGRIWNQLGVHFMETGWDEVLDSMKPSSLEAAVAAYRRAVEVIPESSVFLGNLGDALRQSGKWTEAAELLEKAVEIGSDTGEDAFAVNSLARLEDERSYTAGGSDSSAGDWEKSGHHYRRAADIGDRNADFQRDYAWWLYRERRLEDSIDFYRRAAEINPTDESLPYGESACWLEFGNEKEAMEALERALKIKPSDPILLADKADMLGAAGRAEDAEHLYSDVILKSEEAAWAWERLAEFRERRAEEAEPPDEAPVLSLDGPECFDADLLIAGNRSPIGDQWRRLALKAWNKALKTDPENWKFKARCGAAWMAVGRRDKSRDLLSQVPGHADSMNRLGRLELIDALKLADRNLWNSSKIHLSVAVELAPLEASYHADLGYWHYFRNNREKALEAFRQAADRAPENPEYAANAGICAYASGSYDEGAAYLRRALTMRDREAEWQNALGLSLMASGYPDDALEAFRSACLSDPQSDVYSANLAMAHESLHAPEGPLQ